MTYEQQFVTCIRRSTAEQTDEHQRKDIRDWLNNRHLSLKAVEIYAEQASGASEDRNEFNGFIDDIEAGNISDVVVWEISMKPSHRTCGS